MSTDGEGSLNIQQLRAEGFDPNVSCGVSVVIASPVDGVVETLGNWFVRDMRLNLGDAYAAWPLGGGSLDKPPPEISVGGGGKAPAGRRSARLEPLEDAVGFVTEGL